MDWAGSSYMCNVNVLRTLEVSARRVLPPQSGQLERGVPVAGQTVATVAGTQSLVSFYSILWGDMILNLEVSTVKQF